MRRIALFASILVAAMPAGAPSAPAQAPARTAAAADPSAGPGAAALQAEGLVQLAARMVRAGPAVGAVWPGFWGAEQGFMLLHPRETALLVLPRNPPEDYAPLAGGAVPPELRGRAYLRQAYPPELGPNSFSIGYVVGTDTVPALQPRGNSLFSRLDFYYHESFHGYQHRRFAPSPLGDRRVRMGERLVDSAVTATPGFTTLGELERRLLAQALRTGQRDSVQAVVRAYLAVRRARVGALPQVRAVERSFERLEGTAHWVGCTAAARALEEPAQRVTECVTEELERPLDDFPAMPEADARQMRWRQYGTGAAMALLLDRLEVEWRAQVQAGAYLDELLSAAVGDAEGGAAS